jgi:hypothetical protein
MNKIDRISDALPHHLTMADVIRRIGSDDRLSVTRKRDLVSAVTRACDLLDRDPEILIADIPTLKPGLTALHPAQVGLAAKTLQNIKANVLAAIKHVGGGQTQKMPLMPSWSALKDKLPGKRFQSGLSRFIKFCSDHNIAPDEVSDAVIEKFITYVRTRTLARKPNEVYRRTSVLWNEAVEVIPGWPKSLLTIASFHKPRESTPLEDFPLSFQNDVKEHCHWLTGEDLFADNPPPKPCKPRTVEQRQTLIVLATSALLKSGWSIDQFTSLEDIVSAEALKSVLRHYLDKTNQGPSAFMHTLAKAIIHIARHYVRVDEDHVEALKDLRRRLGPERAGMTEKNKNTLRQFDDDGNALNFLDLPAKMIDDAKRLSERRAGVQVQIALAIAILQHAPLRMHNLIALRLDQHVIRPGGHQGPVHLVVPENEAKGGQTIEYPLKGKTMEVFDLYLSQFRPFICSDECPWLFSALNDKQKSQATLSQQIKERVYKYTGLTITPHQFRHLAAKLLLELNPGHYETVRQLLAHKSSKSTMTFYAGLQTPNAARHYDQLLDEKRKTLSKARSKTGGKGKKGKKWKQEEKE